MAHADATVFYEIAALLALASAGGLLALWLRQPLIVAFIAVGVLAGPSGLDLLQAESHVELLAELGIAVLLFLVGLKLDLQLIRTLGPVALSAGLGQIAVTALLGFALCLALDLGVAASLYLAVALTFSSTIIVVKLLSDKREIDALHGRIALGVLIVQDIFVILAMVAVSAVGIGAGAETLASGGFGVVSTLALGGGLLGAVFVFLRYLAEPLLRRLARSPELLVAFAIGWAACLAALSDSLGFGRELGGLLAGVSIASSSYREAVASRLASLRDFLLVFFFIALGVSLDLSALGQQILPALAISAFVLLGKPLIVLSITGRLGYRRRTGFLAGLTMAQISEFSLIFIGLGVSLGQIEATALSLVTLVALITITVSTYMITYAQPLYGLLEPALGVFERRRPSREPLSGDGPAEDRQDLHPEVLLFGLGRYGEAIHSRLNERGLKVLGVDFDPEAVRALRLSGGRAVYGDAADPEFIAHLPLERVRWAISAVPPRRGGLTHPDVHDSLCRALREQGFRGRIVLTAARAEEVEPLRRAGADLVLLPFRDAADRAAELIVEADAGGLPAGG